MTGQVPLRRHGIAHVETFDVTWDELDSLRRAGGDIGVDFSFGLFCFATAASFLIALLTTEIQSRVTSDAFIFVVIGGFFASAVFCIRWWRNRGEFQAIIKRIQDRPIEIGPVGDELGLLNPSELEELTPEKGGSKS